MKPLKRGQREDLYKPMSAARKAKERRWPEPLEILAKVERVTPGKLASWSRAQPPLHPMPALHAVFISAVTVLERHGDFKVVKDTGGLDDSLEEAGIDTKTDSFWGNTP